MKEATLKKPTEENTPSPVAQPKKTFRERLFGGQFNSKEGNNGSSNESNETSHLKRELESNKEALLAEIEQTILGEAQTTIDTIDHQINVVSQMLEHKVISAKEANATLNKLKEKKNEAKQNAEQTTSEIKQATKEDTARSAKDIFQAIEKGDIMMADLLPISEQKVILNTLSKAYNQWTNAKDGTEKNKAERIHDYYLSLANKIGFTGVREKPAQAPNTTTETKSAGNTTTATSTSAQTERPSGPVGVPSDRLNGGGGGYLGKKKSQAKLEVIQGGLSSDTNKEMATETNTVDQELASMEFVGYKETTMNRADELIKELLAGKIKENDLIDGLDALYPPEASQNLPEEKRQQMLEEFSEVTQQVIDKLIAENKINSATKITKVFKPEKIAAIKKLDEKPKAEAVMTPEQTQAELDNYLEGAAQKADQLVMDLQKGFTKDEQFYVSLIELFPDPNNKKISPEQRQAMKLGLNKLIKTKIMPDLIKIHKQTLAEFIAVTLFGNETQPGEINAVDKVKIFAELADSALTKLLKELEDGTINADEFFDSLVDAQPTKENYGEDWEEIDENFLSLLDKKVMPGLVKIGQTDLAKKIGEQLKPETKPIHNPDKTAVDVQPLFVQPEEDTPEIPFSDSSELTEVDDKENQEEPPEIPFSELQAANSDAETSEPKTSANQDKTVIDIKPFALEDTKLKGSANPDKTTVDAKPFFVDDEAQIIDNSKLTKVDLKQPEKTRRHQQAEEVVDYLKSQKIASSEIAKTVKEILFDNIEVLPENPDAILGLVIADYAKQGDLETAKQLAELGSNKLAQEMTKGDLISYMLHENIIQTKSEFKQYLDSISNDAVRRIINKENAVKISALENDDEDGIKKVA